MPRIIQSPEAFEDIADISTYIVRDNESAATRWIETIEGKLTTLAEFPGVGSQRDELYPGLGGLPVGN
jgi:plasmid stabilization system protein ParE